MVSAVKWGNSGPIVVSAVGRVAQIGELYDSREDKFLAISLFNKKQPSSSIISTDNGESKMKVAMLNTYKEKFNTLDITAEIKLSMLTGLIKLEGSAKFFNDKKQSYRSAKASLIHSMTTCYDHIVIHNTELKPMIDLDVLEQIDATHVVVGIQWGGNVFISIEDTNSDEQDNTKVEGNLRAEGK
ncbi:unnamed protein product [Oppiella nova]|uniref:SNTX MACPF/CDC-like domain-containing protein n=1 Tax=Oppiella nova TaxID=334625 RepID=A0A7R9LP70_9ACAR|nr:unnamed protein product [Oppiella nova]CAG2165607.1 unnamed protein product [Oppiella nova]